ncbi:MAG TPA: lysine--tRNA ligase [Eubacteriaceae bacterium]|nr:lysine--tRNA ligase [Eubacteriaceae bacterium]
MTLEREENINELIQIRRDKLKNHIEKGENPFIQTKYDVTDYAREIENGFESYEGKEVSIAGRIMSKRGQGKVGFYDLQDSSGRIQLFIKKDLIGEEKYEDVKSYDIGDIVGVKGEIFKTKMGQVSVRVNQIVLLSKSLQILPEKFHGLKDPDLRYRQRYVDLTMNQEVKEVFLIRSKIMKAIRDFMNEKEFVEVETPVLSNLAGGANARPFVTHHNALDIDMYLRIALELPLKRLIVGGFDKVYEMGRVFRNEGMDATHNPEFTMLESYQAYADYEDVMHMVEELFFHVAQKISDADHVMYQGQSISFVPPFKKAKMVDLVKEYTGVDFDKVSNNEEAYQKGIDLGLEVEKKDPVGKIIEKAFDHFVEDKLVQPTFVTHHPVEISPLAKKDPQDSRYTERFELFINGAEYANAFSELNDPIDQKERFEAQVANKAGGDEEAHPYDEDFINALEVGLPPTGGLGVGIDRLVMLFTDQRSIRDVLLFPTMKPER